MRKWNTCDFASTHVGMNAVIQEENNELHHFAFE